MENQRLLSNPRREEIKLMCNISYVCSTSGLVQIVELMLPFLSILFVTIQITDEYLIDMSTNWVIIQFVLIFCRLLPFLFYDVEESFYFKRTMTLYEFGITITVLILYIVPIPVLHSRAEPRVLNVMVFLTLGITINAGHILWIIYKLFLRLA